MQIVCDHKKKIVDVLCDEASSIHDSYMKDLYMKDRIFLSVSGYMENVVILGDSAYPCIPWLITPFKNNSHWTQQQNTFNYRN